VTYLDLWSLRKGAEASQYAQATAKTFLGQVTQLVDLAGQVWPAQLQTREAFGRHATQLRNG
jgi:hypothetical protein